MLATAARSVGEAAAELLERLVRITDFSEACSVVLDRVVARGGFDRAMVVAHARGEYRGAGWGVAAAAVRDFLAGAGDPESALEFVLGRTEPEVITRADPSIFPDSSTFLILPFLTTDGRSEGAVLLEADRLDDRALEIHAIFGRCGPVLARCLEVQVLAERMDRLDRRHDLLAGIVDALADPVVLTDRENNIILSNGRAEDLFSMGATDGERRRRAIQINNLLFSSFLTRTVIGPHPPGARELNLVDPSDGSDLLFEALSAPLPERLAAENAMITILRDITDLKQVVSELEVQFKRSRQAEPRARRERDQLNVVLENVGDPILVTDTRAKIILMNPEAEHLLESPVNASAGAMPALAARANYAKFTSVISDFLLQDARRRTETLELTDPSSGAILPVEVVNSKIFDAHGEPVAIVSVLHDLTQVVENERLARELQQLNDELEERIARATEELEVHNRRLAWQSEELEKASMAKSAFLANMSHELRTPLNVLIGYVSLLRDGLFGELNERQADALEKIRTSSRHLLELIDDILDLSKIEAGKMSLAIDEVRIEAIIEEIAGAAEPLVREKGLEFAIDLAPDLPPLLTDRTKVKQILLNLVSNAVKFTESGSVRIEVAAPKGEESIRISVTDTGVGIDATHLETIFEDFRQLDQSTTKRHAGTGLGLSITRKLVALLGGAIGVESERGRGSRFTVELPLITDTTMDGPSMRALLDPVARVERTAAGGDA